MVYSPLSTLFPACDSRCLENLTTCTDYVNVITPLSIGTIQWYEVICVISCVHGHHVYYSVFTSIELYFDILASCWVNSKCYRMFFLRFIHHTSRKAERGWAILWRIYLKKRANMLQEARKCSRRSVRGLRTINQISQCRVLIKSAPKQS